MTTCRQVMGDIEYTLSCLLPLPGRISQHDLEAIRERYGGGGEFQRNRTANPSAKRRDGEAGVLYRRSPERPGSVWGG